MRNLDEVNAAVPSTKFLFIVSLIMPIIMGWGAWALAMGAAPTLPFRENYLGIIGLGIAACAIITAPIPYIFKWNWETKYFGAGFIPFSSGALLGIYPILCIALYSSMPLTIGFSLVIFQITLIIWWCHRFIIMYRTIYEDKDLFSYIYTEEPTAFYYSQRADKRVTEKILKFQYFPSSKFFVCSLLISFSLIPFAALLSSSFDIPFIHLFLGILATPLNLVFLGLSTKVWLVCFFYPSKIKKKTNKAVYVDVSSRPPKDGLENYMKRNRRNKC